MAKMIIPIVKACFIILSSVGIVSAQLSANFYANSCPLALLTIRTTVIAAVLEEARMGASLLRLHYSDCFVQGCDASVLLDNTSSFKGEKTAAENAGSLRGFVVIDNIKSQLEILCPGVVSCADILAVAARDSVVALGGPSWTVQLGRRDSTTASLDSADLNLPDPDSDLNDLITAFANKGFTTKEMVTLSGAHTIGEARCISFKHRLYNDENIDETYATSLEGNCPTSGGRNNLSPLDTTTPNLFDNSYYKNLKIQKGLLYQELFSGGSTDSQVNSYADNPASFRADFANAMIKMESLSPLTGSNGQIRQNCRVVN